MTDRPRLPPDHEGAHGRVGTVGGADTPAFRGHHALPERERDRAADTRSTFLAHFRRRNAAGCCSLCRVAARPPLTETMWIQNTDPEKHPTRRLKNEFTDGEAVSFTENWKANVTESVGNALIEQYDHYETVETNDDENDT